jgi:hypothetical protein
MTFESPTNCFPTKVTNAFKAYSGDDRRQEAKMRGWKSAGSEIRREIDVGDWVDRGQEDVQTKELWYKRYKDRRWEGLYSGVGHPNRKI